MFPRGKGVGAASLPTNEKQAQANFDEFLAARNGRVQDGHASNSQVVTPHTPQNLTHAFPLSRLNAAALLNPKAGLAKSSDRTSASARAPSRPPPQAPAPAPMFTFTSPNDAMELDDDIVPRQGSMIEKMHNLDERAHRPQKRLKRSISPAGSSDGKPASRPAQYQRHGGGDIAQHLKEHRTRLANQEGTTASMIDFTAQVGSLQHEAMSQIITGPEPIDLTSDNAVQAVEESADAIDLTAEAAAGEEPFYMVNGRKIYIDKTDVGEQEVCYGRIEGTRIVTFLVPDPKKPISNRPEWPSMKVSIVPDFGSTSRLKAKDPGKTWFGNLDAKTAYALKSLLDSPIYRLRLEARLDTRSKEQFEAVGQPTSKHLAVTINLYGPRKYAIDPVGKMLSQKQVWLRQPKWVPHGFEVYNPHCNDPHLTRQARKAGVAAIAAFPNGVKIRTAEQEQADISTLFENMQKTEELPLVNPGPNIRTTLLEHQKQGLGWMLQREAPIDYTNRENGSMWKKEVSPSGEAAFVNIVTGHQTKDAPRETLGGLLADMMGLGKSLQLLALLSCTGNQAAEFAENAATVKSNDNVRLTNVKTTLLICPLSVVASWEEQILAHIKEDTMSYYVFHGPSRNKDLTFLAQHDFVITTYPTVKSEFFPTSRAFQRSDHSPLARMNFFRVVLDEAHFVRTPSTQAFKAVCKVSAMRRWCLTATPVQNRLDDLGSLVTFLRVSPFDASGVFAQFILSPFRMGDPEAVKRLRVLVDTITLRRLKDKIDLSPRDDKVERLDFSPAERALYDFFARDASQRVQMITAGAQASTKQKLAGKSYINILRSILCLRQISAHGKELLKDEDLRLVEGQNASHAIDVEEEEMRPALDATQAYSMFDLLKETNQTICASCGKDVSKKDRASDDENPVISTMLPCYQVLCNPCARELRKKTIEAESRGEQRMECPYCATAWRIQLFDITTTGLSNAERLKEELKAQPRKAKVLARYDGPHTKTSALLSCLKDAQAETQDFRQRDPTAKPVKSVVFSAWTTHLDLIGIHLNNHGFKYTTLVGSMNRKQRKEAIEEFNTSDDINVFLISIGTGGVGLNLTAASRVFLMDIGFNPMAEQQAVDRVHRLGQKRTVKFVRFIMNQSIEEKILELHKKKEDLSELSLKRGLDRAEAARQRLENLKELFR